MSIPAETKNKKGNPLIEKWRLFSYFASLYIQYFIAFTIVIAIILSFFGLPEQLCRLLDTDSDSLILFLKYTINIIIAVELIRVLCHQSLNTVVEILLMAITRELIIQHMAPWELLLGVISVGILFVVRKYLYISELDHKIELSHETEEKEEKLTSCKEETAEEED